MLSAGISSVYHELLVAKAENTRQIDELSGKASPPKREAQTEANIHISDRAQTLISIEKDVASFNVRDISKPELQILAGKLQSAGVIDEFEWSELMFASPNMPNHQTPVLPTPLSHGHAERGYSPSETQHSDTQPTQDMVAYYQERMASLSHVNSVETDRAKHMLSLMQNLNAMHHSPTT